MATAPKKKRTAKDADKGAASPKRTRRGASGSGLTAERIRDEALRLIDAEGFESFSTRRLGAALGCEAMAIYWYYPSKDALLDAVVEALIGKLPMEPSSLDGDGDWIEALRRLAHGYRKLAHDHPHAFPLLAMRRFATESTWRFLEGVFELAHQGGLDEHTTARFFRLVSSYCSGVALDELAGLKEAERAKLAPPGEATAQAAAAAEAFPRLSSVAAYLEPSHYDDVFEFGLELLLDSIARTAKTSGTQKARPKRA